MATDRKEVELLIRAREIGTQTFDHVSKSVKALNAVLKDQVDAASRGEASINDLQATMKKLETAGNALIKQQGLVDLYSKYTEQLDAAKVASAAARAEQEKLAAALAAVENPTRAQQRELAGLTKAADSAEKRVATLTNTVTLQAGKLQTAGLAVQDLTNAQNRLVTAAREVGAALTQAGNVIDNYDAQVVRAVSGQKKLADDQAFYEQIQGAKELRKSAEYVSFWTDSLNAAETKERELGSLNTFRKLGEDAAANAAGMNAFAESAVRAETATSTFGSSIRQIIDPAAAARATLAGLEGETSRIAAEIGDGTKPIREYQAAINDLASTQSAIQKLGGSIEAFRNQEAAVQGAATANEAARQKVLALAEAVRTAEAPNEALAASLRDAQAALAGTNAALATEQQRLQRLAGPLQQAGINTHDLADAERRLQQSAEATSASVSKLDKAMAGQNNRAGKFLGLRPYELQNLSYQLNDVFTQIASGTPIMQVFAQQGGQFAQIPGIVKGLVAFLPEILAFAAVFGTLWAAINRVTTLQGDIRDFNKEISATAEGATYSAKALAEDAQALKDLGVKAKDAKEALKDFMHDGISPERLNDFAMAARAVAEVTGEKLPAAAKEIADGFSGGYDAVKKLDEQFDFLTVAERKQIRAMFESGDAARARTEAFNIFYKKMGDAADQARGPWAQSWRNLTGAFNGFLNAIGNNSVVKEIIKDWKEASQEVAYYTSLLPGAKGRVQSASGGSAMTGVAAQGFKSDQDAIIKTAMLEAGNLKGQIAVMSVILNRMKETGFTGTQIVTAKNQFEPLNNAKGLEKLASIDTTSKAYLEAQQALNALLSGRISSGTATNFYSPASQAALAGDGRQAVPSFAKPNQFVGAVSGNNFYNGAFPRVAGHGLSSQPAAAAADMRSVTEATVAANKASVDFLETQKRQLDAELKVSDARRIENAGLAAYAQAMDAKVTPAAARLARQNAETAESYKVHIERLTESVSITASLQAGLNKTAAGADVLSARWAAISGQTNELLQKTQLLRLKGFTVDANGNSLDAIEAQIKAQDEVLKQQALMKLNEEQMDDLSKRLAADRKNITDQVADGTMDAMTGAEAIKAVDSLYIPKMKELARVTGEFVSSLDQAHIDPQVAASLAKISQSANGVVADGMKTQLKFFQDAVSALSATRADAIKAINDEIADGTKTTVEGYKEALKVQDEINPKLAEAAKSAADWARAMAGAHPGPEVQKFLSQMDQIASSNSRGPAQNDSANKGVGAPGLGIEDQKLNEIISQRNELVSTYNELVAQGAMTDADAQAKTQAAYMATQPLIQAQVDVVKKLLDQLLEQKGLAPEAYDAWIAKLQLVGVQAQYVSENFKKIKSTLDENFVQDAVTGFNSMAQAIGSVINGSESLGQGFKDLGNAALTFISSFLLQIADLILQMYLLQALQKSGLFKGLSKGISSLFDVAPMIAGAAAVSAGSAALAASAAATGASGGVLIAGAGALAASAVLLQAAANTLLIANSVGLFHEGGVVGAGGNGRSRMVSPLLFAGAPRYHSGTPGVGLRPDEQAAILQKGEEVLTSNSPRHIKNQIARSAAGAKGAGIDSLKIVNALDTADLLSHALSTKKGERVLTNHIRLNSRQIKTALNGST